MKLDAYLQANDLDDDAFASIVGGCSGHAVKKWRYGERTPRPDAIRRIADVTGGLVGPADFFSAVDEGDAPPEARA